MYSNPTGFLCSFYVWAKNPVASRNYCITFQPHYFKCRPASGGIPANTLVL